MSRGAEIAAPVGCSGWFASLQGSPAPLCQELGPGSSRCFFYPIASVRCRGPLRIWCLELLLGPLVRLGWGAFSAHSFGDHRLPHLVGPRWIPLGRLVPLPTPPPDALRPRFPLFCAPQPSRLQVPNRGARQVRLTAPTSPLSEKCCRALPQDDSPQGLIRIPLKLHYAVVGTSASLGSSWGGPVLTSSTA